MSDLLIDVTRLLGRLFKRRLPTGIDRVCLAYVHRYAAEARAVVKQGPFGVVLSDAQSRDLFALLLETRGGIACGMARHIAAAIMPRREGRVPKGSVLLNVGHRGPEQRHYAEWLGRHDLRPVFMVHDLIPVTHPEYCRPKENARHTRRVETVLRTAAAVITNSNATLRTLAAYAKGRSLPMPPAIAAPLAPAMLADDGRPRPMTEPYFVTLSTIEPRKNHWMMLHVWRRLVERLGADAPRLVVIGQRGWECENVLDLLDRCCALRGFVLEKPKCSDAEMAAYLRHAQALLFPSFVEGYGLPLIEALSLGVPVIASDLPVFREIAGDIPDYLDPLDGPGWMESIERYSPAASQARVAQLDRIGRFEAPTWSAHFEQFEQLLGQVA